MRTGLRRGSGGGFCDGPAAADGTWLHCETVYVPASVAPTASASAPSAPTWTPRMGPGLMTGRHLVVVDVESTGLDPARHVPVEVAAINMTTGEELRFVPRVAADALVGMPVARKRCGINGYYERGLWADLITYADTVDAYRLLWNMLDGNTFGGCNPSFDAGMLIAGYRHASLCHVNFLQRRAAGVAPPPGGHFHHDRGHLDLPPTDLPGLDRCCELLGVTNEAPHTAMVMPARPRRASRPSPTGRGLRA